MNGLDQSQSGAGGKAQALAQRKEAMDAKVADLQNQLEKLANQMRRDEKDAARKLDEAAGSIRDKRIREKIRYTQRVLQQGAGSQQARGMEEDIGANLDALQRKIGEAAGAVGRQSKQDSLARAADKTRDLVRGMESLDQRMRDRAQQARGQQNQQGKAQEGTAHHGDGHHSEENQCKTDGLSDPQGGDEGGESLGDGRITTHSKDRRRPQPYE